MVAADAPVRTRAPSFAEERWPLLVLAALLAFAFVVRVVDLTSNPRGFFTDEASFGLNADLILHTARDEHGAFMPFLFKSFGEYKLPAFVYAEVPFMAVLGRTELAVRLTAAVIGSLTVVTTYLCARELFRREAAALASAAFLAIEPWHVHYSRTGLGDIPCWPLGLTLSLWLFWRSRRLGTSLWPAALAFGLTFYTYRASWVLLPPLLLAIVVLYRRELWAKRRDSLIAAGVLAVVLLPLARHILFGPSDRASQAWIFNIESEKSAPELFGQFYKSYFTSSFLFEDGDNGFITRHFLPGQGELLWVQLPLILVGLFGLVQRLNRRYVVLLLMLPLFPLAGALSDASPISSRTIVGSVVFALLSGAGLAYLVEAAASLRRYGVYVAAGVVAAMAIAAGANFASYYDHYINDYPRLSADYWGWQDGPQAIIAHFLDVQDEYDSLILDGQFNAPEIFVPFYAGTRCPKCIVGGTDRWEPGTRQLFALRPENIPPQQFIFETKGRLLYPDGTASFLFVEIKGKR
ncbi:MAG TPA: glycosyltransferase family 39 protein [Dehalococcoidia bacterium]|nr:glycosyltransferase family 39 protein [Dehalococcoidia bacterium]